LGDPGGDFPIMKRGLAVAIERDEVIELIPTIPAGDSPGVSEKRHGVGARAEGVALGSLGRKPLDQKRS